LQANRPSEKNDGNRIHRNPWALDHPQAQIQDRLQNRSLLSNEPVAFVKDLIEDVWQKPLQPAAFAKHDMFREHINAMAISYFALIVLLILASFPLIAFLVN
jgi:hypothetical protein